MRLEPFDGIRFPFLSPAKTQGEVAHGPWTRQWVLTRPQICWCLDLGTIQPPEL